MTSADIVHEFQAYSHLGEKGGGGGGVTLIFSNIRRPGPFLGLTFWYFVMTPKDIHKIIIPPKIPSKVLKFKILNPKMVRAYV